MIPIKYTGNFRINFFKFQCIYVIKASCWWSWNQNWHYFLNWFNFLSNHIANIWLLWHSFPSIYFKIKIIIILLSINTLTKRFKHYHQSLIKKKQFSSQLCIITRRYLTFFLQFSSLLYFLFNYNIAKKNKTFWITLSVEATD